MEGEQKPLTTWLSRKRTVGHGAWSEWVVCSKATFDAVKATPFHWGMEYETVAVVALPAGPSSPSADPVAPSGAGAAMGGDADQTKEQDRD